MRMPAGHCAHGMTRSEVTTLRWIREHTSLPVPKVIDFDGTSNNDIGCEWVMMDMMRGSHLGPRWRSMTFVQKVSLTERMAEFQAELLLRGTTHAAFRGIGTLNPPTSTSTMPVPGKMLSLDFVAHDYASHACDVPQGPFNSSYDWLLSILKMTIHESELTLANTEADGNGKEEAEEVKSFATRLLSLLPKLFPKIPEECPERTVLWHENLNGFNILVDGEGRITGLLEW